MIDYNKIDILRLPILSSIMDISDMDWTKIIVNGPRRAPNENIEHYVMDVLYEDKPLVVKLPSCKSDSADKKSLDENLKLT